MYVHIHMYTHIVSGSKENLKEVLICLFFFLQKHMCKISLFAKKPFKAENKNSIRAPRRVYENDEVSMKIYKITDTICLTSPPSPRVPLAEVILHQAFRLDL